SAVVMAQPLLTFVAKMPSFSLLSLNSGLVPRRGSADGSLMASLSSARIRSGSASHRRDQPQGDDGEHQQQDQFHQIGDDKGEYAFIDRPYRYVGLDTLQHEDVESQRRMDEAGLDNADIDDAPPQDVVAEMEDEGRHDRHGNDHHRE